ncbi:MAG TPA: cupin domain-containing protein [Actinomycetota bacterium]
MEAAKRPALSLGGIEIHVKMRAEETDGALSALEVVVDPGWLALPHRHAWEDEVCRVLDGEVGLRVDDEELRAGAGAYAFLPRGMAHAYWNPGPAPARLQLLSVPGGVERFYQELAGSPLGPLGAASAARRHGLVLVPEWIPDMVARFGLRVAGG